jgi:hypothetical protein
MDHKEGGIPVYAEFVYLYKKCVLKEIFFHNPVFFI